MKYRESHLLVFLCPLFLPVSFSALQVTYRVVHVTDQNIEGREDAGGAVSVVSTAAFAGAPQAVAQVPQSSILCALMRTPW